MQGFRLRAAGCGALYLGTRCRSTDLELLRKECEPEMQAILGATGFAGSLEMRIPCTKPPPHVLQPFDLPGSIA